MTKPTSASTARTLVLCVVAGFASVACTDQVVVTPATATSTRMGMAGAINEDAFGTIWASSPIAAHAGRGNDSIWRADNDDAIDFCDAGGCERVPIDGVTIESVYVDTRNTSPDPPNAIWVRGISLSGFTAAQAQLGYCIREQTSQCHRAELPGESPFVKQVLAVHRLETVTGPRDVAWLELGDTVQSFWWGPMGTGGAFARCVASPSAPAPTCTPVTIE